jgi:uncharacterized protein YbaR (Trm112 family)
MIHPHLLKALICPENRAPLHPADEQLLRWLNEAIVAGTVKNRAGQTIRERLQGGLVREDQAVLYPIVDDIPVLLVDEGIPLSNGSSTEVTARAAGPRPE